MDTDKVLVRIDVKLTEGCGKSTVIVWGRLEYKLTRVFPVQVSQEHFLDMKCTFSLMWTHCAMIRCEVREDWLKTRNLQRPKVKGTDL